MKAVIQRVKNASVTIEKELFAAIDHGLLVLMGIREPDTEEDLNYIVQKIAKLRIFEDERGKMNLSVKDKGGSILLVSQFTLLANTKKGNRPSFTQAASPRKAFSLYKKAISAFKAQKLKIKTGSFGTHMEIELNNDGPVTIILDSKAKGEI